MFSAIAIHMYPNYIGFVGPLKFYFCVKGSFNNGSFFSLYSTHSCETVTSVELGNSFSNIYLYLCIVKYIKNGWQIWSSTEILFLIEVMGGMTLK